MSMPRSVPFEQLHHRLQVVPALARDPHLVALDRGLDLDLGPLDRPSRSRAPCRGDALLQGDLLARGAARAPSRSSRRSSAFRGTLRFTRRPSSTSRTAFSLNSSAEVSTSSSPWQLDLGARALEVEAGRDLLHGLGDRVLDLLQVHAADDVEGAFGHGLRADLGGLMMTPGGGSVPCKVTDSPGVVKRHGARAARNWRSRPPRSRSTGDPAQSRDLPRHLDHEGGLVALAPVRAAGPGTARRSRPAGGRGASSRATSWITVGPREGHDPGERDVEAEGQGPPRQLVPPGEAVDDAARLARALLLEERRRLVVGLARVDDDGQADLARQPDLAPEHLALRRRAASGRSGSRARSRRWPRCAVRARGRAARRRSRPWRASPRGDGRRPRPGSRAPRPRAARAGGPPLRPRRPRSASRATPASRARATTSSRSASNCGMSMWQWESTSATGRLGSVAPANGLLPTHEVAGSTPDRSANVRTNALGSTAAL